MSAKPKHFAYGCGANGVYVLITYRAPLVTCTRCIEVMKSEEVVAS